MIRIQAPFVAPLASIMTLALGAGYFTSLTTLDLNEAGVDKFIIGCISSSYFCGLLISAFRSQHFILRVGHIRAFATYAACFTVVALLQGLYASPTLWVVLRFVCGYSLAGLAVVVESWLMDASDQKDRGSILAVYMFAYYLAQAMGQLFLTIEIAKDIEKYIMIAIFAAISMVPVCVTRFKAPAPEEPTILPIQYLLKRVPLGVVGCFIAGMILGPLYTQLPDYLKEHDKVDSEVGMIMMGMILGGTLLQYPIGKLSDRLDRKHVLLGVSIVSILLFILFIPNFYDTGWLLLLTFLIGGATFTIYPLSISHTVDHIKHDDMISAISTLLLAYGAGSAIGPILASIFFKVLGDNGMCYYLFVMAVVLCAYTGRRIVLKIPYKYDEHVDYVSIPTTSPNAVPERNTEPNELEEQKK